MASARVFNGLVVGVGEATSGTGGIFQTETGSIGLSDAMHNNLSWIFSPVSKKVGFPLKVARAGCRAMLPSAPGANIALNPLFYQLNPMSEDFASGNSLLPQQEGDVIAMRCDGEDLTAAQLKGLTKFLIESVKEAKEPEWDALEQEEKMEAKERIRDTINPEAFREFFEQMRQKEQGLFGGVTLPLPGDKKYCEQCGGSEKNGGAKLLACGACKKECQKKAWKNHKIDCGAKSE